MMAAMAPKSFFRGAGRNALDLPVAGLSALAAAFAAFAVPQDLLARAVVATGLPSILSAAQPPLGLTARVAIAVAAAALVFGIVFLMLRLFDRSGMSAPRSDADDAMAGPRVRRRDGHPDAPAPRPISAARDLGEPAPPRAHRAAAPAEKVPLWLDEAVPVAAPAAGAEPEVEPEPILELDAAAEIAPEPEPFIAPEPESTPEIAVAPAPAPEPEPEPFAQVWPEPEAQPEPEPEVAVVPEPEPEPEPEPAPEPVAVAPEPLAAVPALEPQPLPVIAAAPEPQPQPQPAPRALVAQADMPSSIGALMERLEQGLARRRTVEVAPAAPTQVAEQAPAAPAAPAAQPAPAPVAAATPVAQPVPAAPVAETVPPQVFPEAPAAPPQVFPEAAERAEPANDRLQSAIASLQRLAARS